MNERILELAEQCYEKHELLGTYEFNKEKFAKLIVRECANLCKVVSADKVSNGSEDYNAGREMGAEVCHNMIKKQFGVE